MMLGLKTLTITYEGNLSPALSNFSLNVQKSDVVVIVGESGCGKTTLLKCIAGFEKPDSGSIVLSDQVMFSNREFVPPQKRKVGMMFQNYALLPHFSVKKNILYGINHLSIFLQHRRLIKLVNLFKIRGLLRKYPHQLSGGEQQRVALIRSLITEPNMLLMDEPFSSIDEKHINSLRSELREVLKLLKITTIIVTHDTQDALALADKVAVIKQGVLQQYSTPKEIYNKPINSYVASFFGRGFFFDAVKINNYFVSPVGDFESSQIKHNNKSKVHLALRPENAEISFEPKDGYTKAIIDQVTFMGSRYYLSLKVNFGDATIRVPAYQDSSNDVQKGNLVYFKVNTDNLIEFD